MNLLQSRASAQTGRRVVIDLQKAERALKDGNHRETEQLCTEILEERTDSAHACQLMADLRLRQRRYDDAMAWIERAREIDADHPRGLYLMARVLEHRGDQAGAEAALRKAVAGDDGYADALGWLGHLLLHTGRAVESEEYFRRAIEHDREHGVSNLSLGALLYDLGRPDEAVPHLQAGIRRELTHRPGQFLLAVALQELGRFDEAVTAFRRLVASGDDDPEVYARLAESLAALGELEPAQAGFEAALEIEAGHPRAAAGLAGVLGLQGRGQAALELLAPLTDRGDAPPRLHVAQARLLMSLGRRDEALVLLADLVKRPAPDAELAPAHFLIGELLDLRGEHERAFAHVRHARRLRGGRYQPERQEAFFDRLIQTFTREQLDALPRGSRSEIPVFIVGLPQSGGALVEHIIASHPRGAGAGSLPHIDLGAGRLGRYNASGLSYPECVSELRDRELKELSAGYLARLFELGEGARRIGDSMWLNFLHIGLIELMFPQARLVHVRRAPLDVGLACHFHATGVLGEEFAAELGNFGHFYAQYRRLMEHWRVTTTLATYEMEYEALLREPAAEIRGLLDFLGLAWDPACLASHENPRILRAACRDRLRQPLDPAAIGWSRHYAAHLAPLREGLAAAGYPPAA